MGKYCIQCGKEFNGQSLICEECEKEQKRLPSLSVPSATSASSIGSANAKKFCEPGEAKPIIWGVIGGLIFIVLLILFDKGGIGFGGSSKMKDLTKSPSIPSGYRLEKYYVDGNYIKGTIRVTSLTYPSITVEVAFYDKDKNLLNTRNAFSPTLKEGDTWAFEVMYYSDDAAYYAIKRVAFVV